jgi:hypothetical protein
LAGGIAGRSVHREIPLLTFRPACCLTALFAEFTGPGRECRGNPGRSVREMAISSLNDVQPRAQAALANSPFYELHDLHVEDRGGFLTISGTVTSFYHKQLAQEVVRSVCKEIEVVNTIHVSDEVIEGVGD